MTRSVSAGRTLLAAGLLLGSCAPLSRLPPPIEHGERWWEAKAPPTPTPTPLPARAPSCSIAVYEKEPAEPFDLIGLVEAQGQGPARSAESALEAAKLEACRLGGDALVLLFRGEKARSGFERIPAPQGTLPDAELRAAVIRFRR